MIKLKCLKDGEYEEKASWPVCREPEKCLELPPLPGSESGLAETTSVVEKEGDEAIYTCSDPDYLVLGDQPDFRVACQKDGFFPMLSEWPECRSSDWTSTTTTTEKPLDPCQCIGDIPVPTARKILNSFCRDPELPGNYFIYNGYTPASRKRCGNRSPNKPTKTNHCYCSTVEEQGSKWSLYDILKRGQYKILDVIHNNPLQSHHLCSISSYAMNHGNGHIGLEPKLAIYWTQILECTRTTKYASKKL